MSLTPCFTRIESFCSLPSIGFQQKGILCLSLKVFPYWLLRSTSQISYFLPSIFSFEHVVMGLCSKMISRKFRGNFFFTNFTSSSCYITEVRKNFFTKWLIVMFIRVNKHFTIFRPRNDSCFYWMCKSPQIICHTCSIDSISTINSICYYVQFLLICRGIKQLNWFPIC